MSGKIKWKPHVSLFLVIICMTVTTGSSVAGSILSSPPEFREMENPRGNDWWPMFRHDVMHSGVSTTTAPDDAEVLWTYQTDFIISSSPAVSHGRVYIGSWDRSIYCLEMDSGNLVWNYSASSEITTSPAVINGKVFIGSQDTYLYCLDASDGSLLWDF
jgi:outer membrane protein assembly factor BamB